MAKAKDRKPTQVVPTPLEEHLGEVWDPRGHEAQIATANELLCRFVEDMKKGRLTELTLDRVREAAGTLGYYSGYPDDAYSMDCFLDSPLASSSYLAVAQALPAFIQDMNALIQARAAKLAEQSNPPEAASPKSISDEDASETPIGTRRRRKKMHVHSASIPTLSDRRPQ